VKILFIAPDAPPKNSPESIQVARHLSGLVRRHAVTLVTTPVGRGWGWNDASVRVDGSAASTIELSLPWHSLLTRLLDARVFQGLATPDPQFWIRAFAGRIRARLDAVPDLVYSRSQPFSSALLARSLKRELGRPWVMHLSDPWVDSPYRNESPRARRRNERWEASCFDEADAISLTTQGQVDFYGDKYPQLRSKLFVSPNVMPERAPARTGSRDASGILRLVYTGALYGERRPTTLLAAIARLEAAEPAARGRIELLFAGNMTDDVRDEIAQADRAGIRAVGTLSLESAAALMDGADVLVSIEPEGRHPLMKTFLPSKLLDYLAANRPILALTPVGSEAWRLCEAGAGWAFEPGDADGVSRLLARLLAEGVAAHAPSRSVIDAYSTPAAVSRLEGVFAQVLDRARGSTPS
jgi:hypothetical protein